jgi:hypothetical protein
MRLYARIVSSSQAFLQFTLRLKGRLAACPGLGQNLQYDRSDIVMRRVAIGECQLAVEDEIQRFGGRSGLALRPNLLDFGGAELNFLPVAQFVKPVSCEQNAVSRGELHDVP